MDQSFRDEMTAGYALTEPAARDRQPDARGRGRQRRPGPGRALDAQPPRADRRAPPAPARRRRSSCSRASCRRPGCRSSSATSRATCPGMAAPGDATNPKVQERAASLNWTFQPSGHPVEFLSLSGRQGAQVRATVHSFGPLLLGKVLDLNETQTSILALVFKYCDDNSLPLLDLTTSRRRSSTCRRTRASRSSRTTAGCRRPRSACSSARSSSSSRTGSTRSSASPSSRSST